MGRPIPPTPTGGSKRDTSRSFADEDVSETARGDVEHAESDLAPEHHTEVERVGVLWECMAKVQARIDALAVQEGAAVLDIAA